MLWRRFSICWLLSCGNFGSLRPGSLDCPIFLCYIAPRYEGVASATGRSKSTYWPQGLACFKLRDSCRLRDSCAWSLSFCSDARHSPPGVWIFYCAEDERWIWDLPSFLTAGVFAFPKLLLAFFEGVFLAPLLSFLIYFTGAILLKAFFKA